MKRIIIVMLVIWLVAMGALLFSPTVRARYWAWRLARAQTDDQCEYFAARLAWSPDAALGVGKGLLTNPSPEVRVWTVRVVQRASKPQADDLLLAAIEDHDLRVRDAAALALGRRGGAATIRRLIDLTRRPQDDIAAAAVFALQRNASPAAVDAILQTLRESASAEVCAQAIESLGLLGITRAEPLLISKLSDRHPVPILPANERSVRTALLSQRNRLELAGRAIDTLSATEGRTVAEYAADAIRRIRRHPAMSSQPGSRPTSNRNE
jgi:hypothetical protein